MTYLAIRRDAADEIISERLLQSSDFHLGKEMSSNLLEGKFGKYTQNLSNVETKNGTIVYGNNDQEEKYVIFDLGQSNIFLNCTEHQRVLYFQRVLRFAIKFWDKGILSPAEKVLSSTTAAIFPNPLSQRSGIRITVDLNPDVERLSKRGKSGRYLLVFKIGTDEGDGVNETATVAGFRKFLDDLEASSQALKVSSGTNLAPWNDSFAATTLQGLSSKVDIHQGYETWLRLLTDDQRDFALTDLTRPTRIEGPAGTGKTASISVAAVHALRMAKEQQRPLRCALFTHSEASRRSIQTVIEAMGGDEFLSAQPISCQLQIVTLQSYCASILHQDLSETEFVDPDAQDAKQLQLMYVEEAMNKTEPEFDSYAPFMSQIFINFYKNENKETLIQLIQHEISVVIKGRAQEKFETYKQIGKIPTGLPLEIDGDKAFIWQLYKNYRAQLVSNAQFDTDDVVLSAFGQLAAPIWRRRRAKDGFDKIFVDETHLFNMNELSIFHLITKSETSFPIAFAVDRSQAIGDRGWSDDIDVDSLMPDTSKSEQRTVALSGIFRCSPDIVNLAFCITSSGANLFTNFEDPMRLAHSNMTFEEEKKCSLPRYLDIDADKDMVKSAFEQAEIMRENMKSARSDIVIVAFSNEIYHEMEQLAKRDHKPVEFLKNRADLETVSKAKATGRFLLSLADYVGGLEFDGAVLVGVDEGRVPPTDTSAQTQSHAYMSFAAHNRLYVSVTRARYQVHILGERSRGPSKILAPAIERGVLLR